MPVSPSYPGIYIEELPSTSHTIAAAPTSIAVFVGYTHPFKTNQFDKAVELFSFTDYEREFGGLYNGALLDDNVAQAVNQFFINGGGQAYVVGLKAQITPESRSSGGITFTALEPTDITPIEVAISTADGLVGNLTVTYGNRPPEIYRSVSVDMTHGATPNDFIITRMSGSAYVTTEIDLRLKDATGTMSPAIASTTLGGVTFHRKPLATNPITITITNATGDGQEADIKINDAPTTGSAISETYTSVSLDPSNNNPHYIVTALQGSALVSLGASDVVAAPSLTATTLRLQPLSPPAVAAFNPIPFNAVFDTDKDLDKLPIFNILVLPGVSDNGVLSTALAFAERKRAFMIIDPPSDRVAGQDAALGINEYMTGPTSPKSPNGALYFPYLKTSDPLSGSPISLPPSGYVAGIFARTDNNRGVWKAPAGLETTVLNTTGVVDDGRMNDMRQGVLNLAGINCLRTFPAVGTVVFGSRTLVSANVAYEQWKYVPVRRMALFIEQTLYSNLTWAVFEPNDEPLWIALRTSVENFMLSLFSNGAFQGSKPSEAFLVRCDKSTTTQTDINNGVVNIIVAFAPLKPAEFVIVKIAQLAGQVQ